jgi:hypothetical protein
VATGLWLAGRWLAEHGREDEARTQFAAALAEATRFGLQPMVDVIQETLDRMESDTVGIPVVDPPRGARL